MEGGWKRDREGGIGGNKMPNTTKLTYSGLEGCLAGEGLPQVPAAFRRPLLPTPAAPGAPWTLYPWSP